LLALNAFVLRGCPHSRLDYSDVDCLMMCCIATPSC
jgi:hypothetical protein